MCLWFDKWVLFLRILVSRMKRLLFVALSFTALSAFLILFTQDYAGIFYPHINAYASGTPGEGDAALGYDFPYLLDLDKSDAILSSGGVWDGQMLEVATGGAYVKNNVPLRAEVLFYVDQTMSPVSLQIESFEKGETDLYVARGTITFMGKTDAIEAPAQVLIKNQEFYLDFQFLLPEVIKGDIPRSDLEVLSVFLHFVQVK